MPKPKTPRRKTPRCEVTPEGELTPIHCATYTEPRQGRFFTMHNGPEVCTGVAKEVYATPQPSEKGNPVYRVLSTVGDYYAAEYIRNTW